MKNTDLKKTYNQMHRQGQSAWFDGGTLERQAIFEMGAPWHRIRVLEIGCGEGELLDRLSTAGAITTGIDYSLEAITTSRERFPHLDTMCCTWQEYPTTDRGKPDVLVMQGVLEHLDDWQQSLSDMIAMFEPSVVITSMPAFINIRGIIWHTLDMLGAVMSKTDLHYIDPWEVRAFCAERYLDMAYHSIDQNWGNGQKMLEDLHTRIPLALKDGGLPIGMPEVNRLLEWLENALQYFDHDEGAVNIYRIDI